MMRLRAENQYEPIASRQRLCEKHYITQQSQYTGSLSTAYSISIQEVSVLGISLSLMVVSHTIISLIRYRRLNEEKIRKDIDEGYRQAV